MNSAGSGDWSIGATWVGGVAPTAADAAVILNTHVVTLADTTCVCDSLTINSGGQLAVNGAADTKLVVDKGIAINSTTGHLNLDMSAAPTKKCEIYINADNGAASISTAAIATANGGGKITMKGAQKTPWTLTRSAITGGTSTTVDVDDASGWVVADKLVFATTQAFNATPKTDVVTIATITAIGGGAYSGTGAATITWTDGTGAGGSVANNHADNCLVGNFTRNLIVGPATASGKFTIFMFNPGSNASGGTFDDVEFRSCGGTDSLSLYQVMYFLQDFTGHLGINRCAFWDQDFYCYLMNAITGTGIPRNNNVHYSSKSGAGYSIITGANIYMGDDTDTCIFRAVRGIQNSSPALKYVRPKISGVTSAVASSPGGFENWTVGKSTIEGGGIWACKFAVGSTQVNGGELLFKETWLGKGFLGSEYSGAGNDYIVSFGGATGVTFDSCPESTTGGTGRLTGTGAANSTEARFFNRDGVSTNQDIYRPKISLTAPCFVREATEIKNANASMRIDTLGSPTLSQEFEILVKGGEAATIFLYVKKNAAYKTGTYTEPLAALTGLGTTLTPVSASAASDGAWELLDLSYPIGDAPSADGVLTLTLSAQSATTTGKCYFSGIPITPFVTRARHYAYVVAETSPTLTADPAIDPAISQATAAAYTGITITWGSTSSISTGADQTFKKLVHYTAAKMVDNVSSALPITWAGAYSAPAIFAQGAIDISADVLSGGGTLDMGSNTLTATLPWAFTYTGGVYSRATSSDPVTFSGGTLNIGAAGTYTYVQAAAMILSMTPTAPGTYALGETTFTGEVDLRNTAAHAITVELPTGASYTTASNTGGTITVSLPVVTADISITGMPTAATATTRLQIINQTALSASAWAANTVYATGAIVKRTTGLGSESTAGLYFRATTGGTSHATTEPTWDTTVGNTTADNTVVWTTYAILYYDDDPAATSLTDTYIDGEEFLDGESVEVRFAEMDGSTSFKTYSTTAVVNSAGFSVLVSEDADDVYATNALDGSDYESTFSPNFTLDYMVLDTNTDFAGKAAFAYYCYTLTTSAGMWGFWGGVTALDEGNYRVNTAILNLYFDESAGFVKQTDNVRIFRDDGTRPAIDPTTGGHGIEINWRTPVSVVSTGGSAVLPQDIVDIAAASGTAAATATLAAAQTTPIHSDVRKVVGITVDGTGTDGDPWGPA